MKMKMFQNMFGSNKSKKKDTDIDSIQATDTTTITIATSGDTCNIPEKRNATKNISTSEDKPPKLFTKNIPVKTTSIYYSPTAKLSNCRRSVRTLDDVDNVVPIVCQDLLHIFGNQNLEGTYQRALVIDLEELGITCQSEVSIPLMYKGHVVGTRRADVIIETADGSKAIIELKAVSDVTKENLKQLQYYMIHMGIYNGYLINFPHLAGFPDPDLGDVQTFSYTILGDSKDYKAFSDRRLRPRASNMDKPQIIKVSSNASGHVTPLPISSSLSSLVKLDTKCNKLNEEAITADQDKILPEINLDFNKSQRKEDFETENFNKCPELKSPKKELSDLVIEEKEDCVSLNSNDDEVDVDNDYNTEAEEGVQTWDKDGTANTKAFDLDEVFKKFSLSNEPHGTNHVGTDVRVIDSGSAIAAVYGKTKSGDTCKTCLKSPGGFCTRHTEQRSNLPAPVVSGSKGTVFGKTKKGADCNHCIKAGGFCTRHFEQRQLL